MKPKKSDKIILEGDHILAVHCRELIEVRERSLRAAAELAMADAEVKSTAQAVGTIATQRAHGTWYVNHPVHGEYRFDIDGENHLLVCRNTDRPADPAG